MKVRPPNPIIYAHRLRYASGRGAGGHKNPKDLPPKEETCPSHDNVEPCPRCLENT